MLDVVRRERLEDALIWKPNAQAISNIKCLQRFVARQWHIGIVGGLACQIGLFDPWYYQRFQILTPFLGPGLEFLLGSGVACLPSTPAFDARRCHEADRKIY